MKSKTTGKGGPPSRTYLLGLHSRLEKKLQVGQIISSKVIRVDKRWAFIQIGAIWGFLHISQISKERVTNIVVVKYMGDTFFDLSYEKQPGHPHKTCSPVPPEGLTRKGLSAGRVESIAV